MSKEIEWGTAYGEGTVVCTCDHWHKEEGFDVEDNDPDYRGVQDQLYSMGWLSLKFRGKWYDFCCESCRNTFMKTH